jgi:hypothetical protein
MSEFAERSHLQLFGDDRGSDDFDLCNHTCRNVSNHSGLYRNIARGSLSIRVDADVRSSTNDLAKEMDEKPNLARGLSCECCHCHGSYRLWRRIDTNPAAAAADSSSNDFGNRQPHGSVALRQSTSAFR